MKGLIFKEFITTFKNNKFSIFVIPLFALLGLVNKQNMFVMLVPVLTAMLPLGQMTHDELCHWDRYVQCMPVDKKKIVSSKYAMVIILSVISAVIIGSISGILAYKNNGNVSEVILMILTSLLIGAAVPCLSIPVNLKFGTAKGRTIYMIIVAFVCGVIPVAIFSDSKKLSSNLMKLFSNTTVFCAVAAAVFVVMMLISWLISLKIYENKEV